MTNSFYRTEIIATLYKRQTGRLAPFKDSPAALGNDEEWEKNNKLKYEEWRKDKMLTAAIDYCVELEERVEALEYQIDMFES